MKAKTARNLRRRQLDRIFNKSSMLRHLPNQERGWIREIRETLGMSGPQLARRMGVSPPTVNDMEKSEAAGTISVQTLRKAAEAMGLDFVYAFVPSESLEAIVRARATEVAARFYAGVNHTMALEAQSGDDRSKREQVAELADELVRGLSRDLWEDPHETDIPRRGHTA